MAGTEPKPLGRAVHSLATMLLRLPTREKVELAYIRSCVIQHKLKLRGSGKDTARELRSLHFNVCVYSCFSAGGADGLEINPVASALPLVIKNGTVRNAVLDCDYALNDDDYASNEKNPGALVVKWFFNNDPAPVYQWIHSKKPQGLGVLNGKLNLEYRVSNDNATMYRALQIINPTTELSGEYKCTVSTFNEERSQTRKMIIYGKFIVCRSDNALLIFP
jgi:hypothetical protein